MSVQKAVTDYQKNVSKDLNELIYSWAAESMPYGCRFFHNCSTYQM